MDFEGYDRLLQYAEENGAHIGTLIVSVCMENDLREYESDEPEHGKAGAGAAGVKDYLTKHSAIYGLATVVVHRTPWLRDAAAQAGLLIPNLAAIAVSDTSDGGGEIIGRAAAASRRGPPQRDPDCAVACVVGRYRRASPAGRADARDVRPSLASGGAAGSWTCGATFEQQGSPLSLHFANDGHWNAEGHRIAGEALAQAVGR